MQIVSKGENRGFGISRKLSPEETISTECQIMFSEKKKQQKKHKNNINLSSAEFS